MYEVELKPVINVTKKVITRLTYFIFFQQKDLWTKNKLLDFVCLNVQTIKKNDNYGLTFLNRLFKSCMNFVKNISLFFFSKKSFESQISIK